MKKLRRSSFVQLAATAGLLVLNAAFLPSSQAAQAKACGGFGQEACSVSPAEFAGKKPSGCPRGSFFDPIDGGTCWSCPANFIRHVTHVKAGDACVRLPSVAHTRAKRHARGHGLLGTDCSKGQFWDPNGYCWSCPRGYVRTLSPVTAGDACAKPVAGSTTHATFVKSVACPPGSFFDLVDGGTCWRCPRQYVRTLAHVKAPNACAVDLIAGVHKYLGRCSNGTVNVGGVCLRKGDCGALGQRPCLLTERFPSCNKGIAEDFIKNRCVEDQVGRAACMILVDAIWVGKDVVGLLNQIPSVQDISADLQKRLGLDNPVKLDELKGKAVGEVTRPLEQRFPELQRIAGWMNDAANLDKLRQIFSAQAVCSKSAPKLDDTLKRYGLVPKEFVQPKKSSLPGFLISDAEANWLGSEDPNDRHFYMGYLIGVGGAKVVGVTIGFMGVTDFRGNGGMYLFLGPKAVSNIGGGVDGRVLFYTSANMGTFEGWGWSVGGNVEVKKPGNIGAELIFEGAVLDKLIAGQKTNLTVLRGFGIGGGAGAGKSPVEAGVTVTHAWRLK